MDILSNYIDGKLVPAASKGWLDNIDPARGCVYGQIPDSNEVDVQQAVDAAERAFPHWSGLSADERAKYLTNIADLIDHNLAELALAESIDNGKPVNLAEQVDIPRAASNFRFFAQAITQFSSESHQMGSAINYTLRDPIGVVGCISPWNLPLYLFTWKIAPALAAGNCVVAKPSEVTPKTAALLAKLCIEAGLPSGVLNILHGQGQQVGAAISAHPAIKAISFTGGTATGQEIARVAAPMFKKLSLELGGKNPALVFDDCDFEQTVEQIVRAAFTNQGQICLCASRIYVQSSIYAQFKQAFIAKVNELVVGDPLNAVNMGALVSKAHLHKVLSYVELAKQEGGTLLAGGKQVLLPGRCQDGFFMQPTVIEGLGIDSRCNQEEIFGPVITIQPFDTDEDGLMLANATDYGLAASVWTQDLRRSQRFAKSLQFGIVWINCWMQRDLRTPFGGMKQSGVGREGGLEALRFFTEPKNICINYA